MIYDVNTELIAKSISESNTYLVIKVPEEFYDEVKSGCKETIERVFAELSNRDELFLVGKYEIETLVMLRESLKHALIKNDNN